jgi:uncharacterized membrane protein YdbT with pleckstrin-like domain
MKEEELSFNGQRKGEKIEEVIKNHPFVLLWPGIKMIFFFLLGTATMIYFPSQYAGMVLVICVLIGLGIFMRRFYDYSQSVFLITNQRLINVFQDGFLKRKITETDLNKVQDASSSTSGLFKTMLKFGDLTLRTAGASKGEEIIVKNIPHPYEVQQRIANIKK